MTTASPGGSGTQAGQCGLMGRWNPSCQRTPPDFLTQSPRSCRVCRGTWKTSVVDGADWDFHRPSAFATCGSSRSSYVPSGGGSIWTWAAPWGSVTLASGRQWNGEEWSLFRGWAETFDKNLIGWVKVTPELEAEDPRGPKTPFPPPVKKRRPKLNLQTPELPNFGHPRAQKEEPPVLVLDACQYCGGWWKKCSMEQQKWARIWMRDLLQKRGWKVFRCW